MDLENSLHESRKMEKQINLLSEKQRLYQEESKVYVLFVSD